ncbi:uncharacterized protein LOC111638258 [Centruroides sculpturatus]|uniref:uncharacterized protein LOC111638258 n=1 Tax=Centruroides sculpturatus TaxID=218467 RepID=UPI000C6EA653|nr:uncharacterized protein LOC111638258 [Centruroides sculpturatus]
MCNCTFLSQSPMEPVFEPNNLNVTENNSQCQANALLLAQINHDGPPPNTLEMTNFDWYSNTSDSQNTSTSSQENSQDSSLNIFDNLLQNPKPDNISGSSNLSSSCHSEKRFVDLSNSDYEGMQNCFDFIDKSLIAWYFFHDPDSRLLATAPARFGKTSILKMLHKFFSIQMTRSGVTWIAFKNVKQEDGRLVEDPNCMSEIFSTFKTKKIFTMCHCSTVPVEVVCNLCKQWFYHHCQQYPVIYIDFGTVSSVSLRDVIASLNDVIRDAFKQHPYLIKKIKRKTVWSSTGKKEMGSHDVSVFLKYYDDVQHRNFWRSANTTVEDRKRYLVNGLPLLAEYLSLHFKIEQSGKGVILFVDEFDAPISELIFQKGEKQKLYQNIIKISGFLRLWTRSLLKECQFVKKVLVTSCVAIVGTLSLGANNIQFRLFLDSHYFSEAFGFTEDEVKTLVDSYLREEVISLSRDDILRNIDQWYNGYPIIKNNKKIFSIYSILSYLRSGQLRAYWKDKVGSSCLDAPLAEDVFHEKVFQLLGNNKRTVSIDVLESVEPAHICTLNELVNNPVPETMDPENIDLYLQFLTECGFFTVTNRTDMNVSIRIPNCEINRRLRQKVLSGMIKKRPYEFDSSKVSALITSLQSLETINVTWRNNKALCIAVAESVANLYSNVEKPSNQFKIQADLYFLIRRSGKFSKTDAELAVDTGNSPRIDIYFITNGTAVVVEVNHFNTETNVDSALERILNRGYHRICEERFHSDITGNKILLGIYLAADGKVSVGCLVNIDGTKSREAIMSGRVCVDSDRNTLYPLDRQVCKSHNDTRFSA